MLTQYIIIKSHILYGFFVQTFNCLAYTYFMKFSKIFNKKKLRYLFKIYISVLIVLYMVFAPISIFPQLIANQNKVNENLNLDYVGVLELWNIDTFEGGSVSRTRWLEKRAIEFENKHKGTYIVVNNMTPEQARMNVQSGKKPDMISFGIGVGEEIFPLLNEYTGKINVREDLLNGGKINSKIYAMPYILGGYILASENELGNNLENVGFGNLSSNNFSVALCLSGLKVNTVNDKSFLLDSFMAYEKFLTKNFDVLCGTQRDAYRLNNKVENGSLNNVNFKYLSGFTDLIQYIGISTTSIKEKEICTKFIEYVTNEEVQNTISNISMFSVLNKKIYSSSYLNDMENELMKEIKTINVFLSGNKLQEIKDVSINYLTKNEADNLKKLKQYLI